MGFSTFLGNRRVVEVLRRMLRTGRLPHALLFAGPVGLGKFTLARMLALAANCEKLTDDFCGSCESCRLQAPLEDLASLREAAIQSRGRANPEEVPLLFQPHPDVCVVVPDGQFIRIGQVREVRKAAYLRPYRARRRFFIFDGAEQMRAEAANSMLKVLEEPPETATLVLVSHLPFALLPTIRSRAVPLHFGPLPPEEIEAWLKEQASLKAADRRVVARLADGSIGHASSLNLARSRRVRGELLALLSFTLRPRDFDKFFERTGRLAREEKENFENLLDMLYSLLNDVLGLKTYPSGSRLRNIDFQDELAGLAKQISLGWIRRATGELDQIGKGLRRNLNRQLALEAMLLGLVGVHPDDPGAIY